MTTIDTQNVRRKMASEETSAWKALAKYNFYRFGWHVGTWLMLNKLLDQPQPNPFTDLVKIAKEKTT